MSKMSEEEAIETLKHVNIVRKFSGVYSTTETIHEAIETILDLYKQEREKNNRLEKFIENGEYTWKQKYKETFDYVRDRFIDKDKIRDMKRYREFELQQEYKDFENDVEWKTYNKILEEK